MLGVSGIGQSLIAWILKKYLGRYVADIDTRVKNFQYGIGGG